MAQTTDDKSSNLFIALAKLSVLAIITTMSIIFMLRVIDHFRPRVGDIVAFHPINAVAPDTETKIEVTPAGAPPVRTCLLDASAMRRSGGSLIIEAVRADSPFAYRVHWAGGPTSEPRTNCGTSAELLLSQAEIGTLKLAASQ